MKEIYYIPDTHLKEMYYDELNADAFLNDKKYIEIGTYAASIHEITIDDLAYVFKYIKPYVGFHVGLFGTPYDLAGFITYSEEYENRMVWIKRLYSLPYETRGAWVSIKIGFDIDANLNVIKENGFCLSMHRYKNFIDIEDTSKAECYFNKVNCQSFDLNNITDKKLLTKFFDSNGIMLRELLSLYKYWCRTFVYDVKKTHYMNNGGTNNGKVV